MKLRSILLTLLFIVLALISLIATQLPINEYADLVTDRTSEAYPVDCDAPMIGTMYLIVLAVLPLILTLFLVKYQTTLVIILTLFISILSQSYIAKQTFAEYQRNRTEAICHADSSN